LTSTSQPPAHSSPGPTWPDTLREAAFWAWFEPLCTAQGWAPESLSAASADASFRRYLRVHSTDGQRSAIVMDAPPPQEDVRPFVHVAGLVTQAGLRGPQVLAADAAQGFLLLSDLGRESYLATLQAAQSSGDSRRADELMRAAVNALVQWQTRVPASALPPFDRGLLQRELDLFAQWCIATEHGLHWNAQEHAVWQALCERLIENALAQPVVAVHADWMPRNLMIAHPLPGILDFQDAVAGPISYDLASLLRDAFISWEEEQELDWAVRFWQQARSAGLLVAEDFGEFWRALEWMGLQRHLKVMGIFCRLKHRDGKAAYVQDLPRFVAYASKVAMRYGELRPLMGLLEPLGAASVSTGLTF
jgi:aminoglycoside/choline kinase family phosphotransferase